MRRGASRGGARDKGSEVERRRGHGVLIFFPPSLLFFILFFFFPFQYESARDSDDESEESDDSEKEDEIDEEAEKKRDWGKQFCPVPSSPSLLFPLSFFIASSHLVYSC